MPVHIIPIPRNDFEYCLRLSAVQTPPAGSDPKRAEQARHPGDHAHRRRQIAVLPDSRLLLPGLTVVVSPLIALMKDQVEQLDALGVPALFLNSSLSFDDYQVNMALVRSGEIKLLYVAPETLLTPRLLNLLESVTLCLPDHRRSALHLRMGP